MHIVRLITSFRVSDPSSCNHNLGNRCQTFCSKDPSPNIVSRLIVGIVIKDVARISAIAIHSIVGLVKLTICAIKLTYSIPARSWGSIPNYEIGKEGLVHLGFSGFYFADLFISSANMINRYPKDLIERVENCFSEFLSPKINNANKEEVHKIQLEKPQTASCSQTDTDSDTSFEKESSQSQQEDPLYQTLVECGTDPEKSKILATNYSSKYPKSFRHSIHSIISEY